MTKTAAAAKKPAPKKTVAEPENCRCNCGEAVNAGRMFRQGHDQRLVSKIAEDLVNGTGRGMRILKAEDAKEDIAWRIDQVRDYVTEKISAALGAKVYAASMRRWQVLSAREDRVATRAAKVARGEAAPKRTRKPKAAGKPMTAPVEEAPTTGIATPVPVGEVPADPFQGLPETGTDHPKQGDLPAPAKAPRRRRAATKITVPADIPETDVAPKRVRRAGPVKTAAVGLGAPVKIKVRNRTVEATVAAMSQAGKVTVASYVDSRGAEKRVENPRMVSHPDAQVGTD